MEMINIERMVIKDSFIVAIYVVKNRYIIVLKKSSKVFENCIHTPNLKKMDEGNMCYT